MADGTNFANTLGNSIRDAFKKAIAPVSTRASEYFGTAISGAAADAALEQLKKSPEELDAWLAAHKGAVKWNLFAKRGLLWVAAQSHNAQQVKALLKHGAEADRGDLNNVTPLMAASENARVLNIVEAPFDPVKAAADTKARIETIDALLQAGANPTLKDLGGNTARSLSLNAAVQAHLLKAEEAWQMKHAAPKAPQL